MVMLDLEDKASIQLAVSKTKSILPSNLTGACLDVLIHNAMHIAFDAVSPKTVRKSMNVNCQGMD